MAIFTSKRIYALSLLAVAAWATPSQAANVKQIMGGVKDKQSCEKQLTSEVNLPSQYLAEQWETNSGNPCPNYDRSSSAEVKCKDLVDKLEQEMKQWLAAHKAHCDLLTHAPKCDQGGASQTKCLEDHRRTLQAASASVEREKREVERVITEFEEAQKKMANSVGNLPANNSPPRRMEQTTRSTAAQLAQFAQKIAQGKVTESDISRTTDPMVQEPLVVAEMLQEVRQQLNRREAKLKSTSSELGRKSAIDSANIADNSSLTKGLGGGAGGSGGNGAGDLAKAAAGGLGSLAQAGGGAGSSTGGSGGGSPYSPGGLAAEDRANGNSGSSPVGLNNTNNSGRATNQPGEAIDFTEKAVALQAGAEGGEYGASGASSSQSLKDSLRAKLKKGGNSAPNGESLGASASAGAGGGNTNKTAGTNGNSLAPLAGLKSEDVFAGLGGGSPLGGGESFDLAGSETDAFVKSMVGSLSEELGDEEGDRSLASMESREEGVLEENTESLFLRTKSTLVRSVKRGNLVTNLRSKL